MATHNKKCAFDGKPIGDDEPFVTVHHGDAAVPVKLDNLGDFAAQWRNERGMRAHAEELARKELDLEGMSRSEAKKALDRLTDKKVGELRAKIADKSGQA